MRLASFRLPITSATFEAIPPVTIIAMNVKTPINNGDDEMIVTIDDIENTSSFY